MTDTIIDTDKEQLELVTYEEVCELMQIKASTFYQNYANKLTAYKNADRPEDRRFYYDKKEVDALLELRVNKPTKVIAKRPKKENNA